MKNEIMQNLSAVLCALNCVDVRGKQNLANMTGSIKVLENVIDLLRDIEFAETKGS